MSARDLIPSRNGCIHTALRAKNVHVPTIKRGRSRASHAASHMATHEEPSYAGGGITDHRHAPAIPSHHFTSFLRTANSFYALASSSWKHKLLFAGFYFLLRTYFYCGDLKPAPGAWFTSFWSCAIARSCIRVSKVADRRKSPTVNTRLI